MFDCAELREMRQQLADFASRFDADLLEGTAAVGIVSEAAAIENMAASIKAEAARRVAVTHAHRRDGHRSAAHHLAHTSCRRRKTSEFGGEIIYQSTLEELNE